ncbi:hypothetical protein WBG78_19470 [Chryseolinea sp. T2]|uniref:hypothetical protein n=1 Tax=Chryseolinea sp. T2 TaxID=3129255 RepID=UPI003076B9D8
MNASGPAPTPTVAPQAEEKKPVRATPRTTINVGSLLKIEPKKEAAVAAQAAGPEHTEPFTLEMLHAAWEEFAVTRRALQAEYHLLSQPFDLSGTRIELHLLSPVQETMLNGFKADLIGFLRTKLKNDLIQVTGVIRAADEKKMIYTPRDKFEYLQGKIPILKEFKDRLGLDTDF